MPGCGDLAAMTARSQAEAVARNDALFRDANERINDVARSFDPDDGALLPFLCECADVRCTEVVQLSAREYEELRRDPTRFATAPGHEGGDTSARVVAENDRYATVEKLGAAARVAVELDRRAGGRS
jgi:hypothetical protein